MNEPLEDHLKPTELGANLGLQPRQTRYVLGTLEALGFALVPTQGVRLCPPGLAAAVRAARRDGRELASLRVDPALRSYLSRDARGDEPLERLVALGVEVALLRETVGALWEALRCGGPGAPRLDWRALGVADPHREL